jgi:hypothetical protein
MAPVGVIGEGLPEDKYANAPKVRFPKEEVTIGIRTMPISISHANQEVKHEGRALSQAHPQEGERL